MKPVSLVVQGALGKMGRELINALPHEPGLQLVGAVDAKATDDSVPLPDGLGRIPLSSDLDNILATCRPDVVVDFTIADATRVAAPIIARRGVNAVIGTTGLNQSDVQELSRLAQEHNVGIMVAPNFTLGAIVMMHLAKIAAKYFDYAEITELHHHQKADFPSGTALSTARLMVEARGKPFFLPPSEQGEAPRGRGKQVDGVTIHSVRLPGLMAHQEVLFGTAGQTLLIRHDTIGRECYMPGVILAIREVVKRPGLIYGLENLLNLQEG
ncbi:MAG: 4-hydroxy-tetrahydrodipicolinate reductase [Chloroflexi bacterium]|nr:4-hydroxy-tetrahydrodipicolinate reductase [Chloroflexota bacterium]